ncbi:MAG: LOG family protein [Desulfobacterales bacterium]|jgi:predicted Rossmann-fold nucleotide-binding protein|nr:LOG family protein [Desulfobacterales bacterium]MDD3951884.1 LOG family protein [Desulfobacterales bacterium]MDD4464937.1 LOG family protein [Desulfobacterales bacterium]MDY0377251.1 LOG family protein [Desulfobacterales bacterium]
MKKIMEDSLFRGLLQSEDGIITEVVESNTETITFRTAFRVSNILIHRLKTQPQNLIFSERSRIARLGIQIECQSPQADCLEKDILTLTLTASSEIPGYPGLYAFKDFFTTGLAVGRLVFCDPEAMLTSDEVLEAIERAEIKLPASTTISSDGSILIAPHRAVCKLREPLSQEMLGRILFKENGREILNRYQIKEKVSALTIPPGQGVITTCSMFLNEHYVVLQAGSELGRHLPATILDPIKTRGIGIYLEIVNRSKHPIVNPLISARIYRAPKPEFLEKGENTFRSTPLYTYDEMRWFENRLNEVESDTCPFLAKPAAIVRREPKALAKAEIYVNGPDTQCTVSRPVCALQRRIFTRNSSCAQVFATSKIARALNGESVSLALKYFPNIIEHRDIINLACNGTNQIESFYFFEPSREHGQFLSQLDHNRLQDYHDFGIDVFWVSRLNSRLMVHAMRDGKGYFVTPERLTDFHKSMLFAFFGSNLELSEAGVRRLDDLIESLVGYWGQNIGIVTGGGSGVMEHVNTLARKHGILSGANYLDITDQPMTTDVDFCQVFQATCRHSRQKWFEVASFPIFNIGGIGSLEELGITLCNMKLAIMDRVPVILFDTEGEGEYWRGLNTQIRDMIRSHRAPEWIEDNIIITGDPDVVINAYRNRLQLF